MWQFSQEVLMETMDPTFWFCPPTLSTEMVICDWPAWMAMVLSVVKDCSSSATSFPPSPPPLPPFFSHVSTVPPTVIVGTFGRFLPENLLRLLLLFTFVDLNYEWLTSGHNTTHCNATNMTTINLAGGDRNIKRLIVFCPFSPLKKNN